MLKRGREWSAENNGKLPHLFIPSKTATLIPAFVVNDLPLGRILMMIIFNCSLFCNVCAVLAEASVKRVDPNTASPPEAAMTKIDENRRK